MKLKELIWAAVAIMAVAGCTGDTSVSRQPSEQEIQAAIERRIAEVDKQPGLSPEAKERMKAQIRGNRGPATDRK